MSLVSEKLDAGTASTTRSPSRVLVRDVAWCSTVRKAVSAMTAWLGQKHRSNTHVLGAKMLHSKAGHSRPFPI